MDRLRKKLLATFMCLLPCAGLGQSVTNPGCTVAPPDFATGAPNIFNDQQEQDLLGEMFIAGVFRVGHAYRPSASGRSAHEDRPKPAGDAPKTGVTYRFSLYESGEINAFSLAGGRVYVSRKLIAAIQELRTNLPDCWLTKSATYPLIRPPSK